MAEKDLIDAKISKLNKLQEQGINAYPYSFEQSHKSQEIKKKHSEIKENEFSKEEYSLAGRIMFLRNLGKLSFLSLRDEQGDIQVVLKKDELKEKYKLIKLLDIGDIIGVKGNVSRTKTGEISIFPKELTILTKATRPMPEKFHGINDTELKYRERYLDLIMNLESREVFRKRAKIISEIRRFFEDRDFIELETPTLDIFYGGANAKPFITKHNELDMKMYLKISPELYLKKLIVGGLGKVFEIGKCFRNEGIDTSHNPEFTTIEWYEAYTDFNYQMKQFEELVAHLCYTLHNKYEIEYQGEMINFKPPWKRISMIDAIKEKTKLDVLNSSKEDLIDFASKKCYDFSSDMTKGELIALIFEEECEEDLIQPTFVTEHPVEISPLTKRSRKYGAEFVERFEPFCFRMEIGNAYSELTNPVEQRQRFDDQEEARKKGNEEIPPNDKTFLKAIDYGMPPTGGVGLGIDRVVMLLTNQASIRDVLPFPTMKQKEE